MKKTAIILALMSIQISFAQTINTETTSFSVRGTTVAKNIFQLETNVGISIRSSSVVTNHIYTLPEILLRYGITNRLEVQAGTYISLRGENYSLESLNLGLKYNIIGQNSERFQMSAIATYSFPNSNIYSVNNVRAALAFEYLISDKHSLGANVGYNYKQFDFTSFRVYSNNFFGTLIYRYQVLNNLSCFVEGYWNTAFIRNTSPLLDPSNAVGVENGLFGDVGLLYQINNRMQIDYVYSYGGYFNSPIRNQFHKVGFHFMLGGKK